jgi:hypothetical protein
MHCGPNRVAARTPCQCAAGCGGFHRNSPIGGAANPLEERDAGGECDAFYGAVCCAHPGLRLCIASHRRDEKHTGENMTGRSVNSHLLLPAVIVMERDRATEPSANLRASPTKCERSEPP